MIAERRCALIALAAMAVAPLAGCATSPPVAKREPPNGTVELNQANTSETMGGGGKGRVYYGGQAYRFTIGGLGVDGSAIAVIATTGEVYRLASRYLSAPDRSPAGCRQNRRPVAAQRGRHRAVPA